MNFGVIFLLLIHFTRDSFYTSLPRHKNRVKRGPHVPKNQFFFYLDLFVLIEVLVLAFSELVPLVLALVPSIPSNSPPPAGSSKMVSVSREIIGEIPGFDLLTTDFKDVKLILKSIVHCILANMQ